MKKTLFILTLFITSNNLPAQELGVIKFGVKGGANISSITNMTNGAINSTSSSLEGLNIGAMAQYLFNAQLGIESGCYYSTLGGAMTTSKIISTQTTTNHRKISAGYLQIPVLLLYKFDLKKDFYLYPTWGIYLGYGINGDIITTMDVVDTNNSSNNKSIAADNKFFGTEMNDGYANKFDYGTTFGLNFQYSKYIFGVAYDLGLAKLKGVYTPQGMNRDLKITVGYFFQ